MLIIPAIDVRQGRMVRLYQGKFSRQTEYPVNPVARAIWLEGAGFGHLHLVDLDGARRGQTVHLPVLKQITRRTRLKVDFGGGITNREALRDAFRAGAWQVNIGSAAVQNPEMVQDWLTEFGPDRIIIAVDLQNEQVAWRGWQVQSAWHWQPFLEKMARMGVRNICVTNIARDGTLQGPDLNLYRNIVRRFPQFRLIASGGIRTVADLDALYREGVHAAIVGKALLEGRLRVEEVLEWQAKHGTNQEAE